MDPYPTTAVTLKNIPFIVTRLEKETKKVLNIAMMALLEYFTKPFQHKAQQNVCIHALTIITEIYVDTSETPAPRKEKYEHDLNMSFYFNSLFVILAHPESPSVATIPPQTFTFFTEPLCT